MTNYWDRTLERTVTTRSLAWCTLGVVFGVGLSLAALAARAPPADVAGTWTVTLNTEAGETEFIATFEQDGSTLSGEIDIGNREILPIEGSVEGNTITFTFVVVDLDGDQPIHLSGEIAGDTITGDEGRFIYFGSGNWTGAKQE